MANKSEIIPVSFKADHIFDVGDYATINAYQKSSAYTAGQITTVNNKYSELSQTVDNISSTVSNQTTQINNLSGQVSTNKTNISSIDQKADQIKTTVESHTSEINNLSGQVSTNTTNISKVDQKADSISSTVSSQQTTINNLNTQVSTNTTNISKVDQKADSISSTVSNQTTQINNLSGQVSTNTTNISNVTQTANGLASTVSSHTTQINNLNGDVSDLNDDVSTLKQEASAITAQVNDTYLMITDGNITLNGNTTVNGDLTLSDSEQGFILKNGQNTLQLKPTLLPSYNNFINQSSVQSNISLNYVTAYGGQNVNSDYVTFNYSYTKNLGKFTAGSIIKFSTLSAYWNTKPRGAGNSFTPNVTFKILENNTQKYSVTYNGNTHSIPDYTVQSASYDVIVLIQVSGTVLASTLGYLTDSKGNIIQSMPMAYLTLTQNITLPTTSTFVIIATNGMGINFGDNKHIYIGDEGFVASYGNYKFRVDSNGFVQNNTHRIYVMKSTTYAIPDNCEYDTFIGYQNDESTIYLPKNPYDGQTIFLLDKFKKNWNVNTNGHKRIANGETYDDIKDSGSFELANQKEWQFIWCKELNCWIQSVWNW